jgi:chemotaxis protein methyltransferase CheR
MSDAVAGLAALLGQKLNPQLQTSFGEAIRRSAAALKLSPDELVRRARDGDRQALQLLLESAVIGETYFFRHPEHFEHLEEAARRARASGRPFRSAWSVGCSTGEEAYSIAAVLQPLAPEVRVLGTDVSPAALERARAGGYGAWSRRGGSRRLEGTLLPSSQGWTVAPELRARVHFSELNLAEGRLAPPAPLPPQVDVIFCRNVLLYLLPERAQAAVTLLGNSLAEDGLLVLSALDAPDGVDGLNPVEGAPGLFTRPAPAAAVSPPRASLPSPSRNLARLPTASVARGLADAGDLDGALSACVALGESPEALLLAASIHAERQELDRAELLLRRLLLQLPEHLAAHLRLALIIAQRGDAEGLARSKARLTRLLGTRRDETQVDDGLTVAHVRQILAELVVRERL